jgi:hypothetical protein
MPINNEFQWKNPTDITKEQWMHILNDEDITTKKDMQLLAALLTYDRCRATASQLAPSLNMPTHHPINRLVGYFGKRAAKKYGTVFFEQHTSGWWGVPFLGEDGKEGFYWMLRPNLEAALRAIEK